MDDFTYVSRRGQTTVDYILCTIALLDIVCDLTIGTRIESDHLPVTCGHGTRIIETKNNKN